MNMEKEQKKRREDAKNKLKPREVTLPGIKDDQKVTGELLIQHRGPDGRVKHTQLVKNLVVTAGKEHIADQMSDQNDPNGAMTHMAVGTGVTAQTVGDTALVTELNRRIFNSKTQSTTKVIYVTLWPEGEGTGALTEAGIFNATSGGTMLARTTFTVRNKGAGDTITLTWTITFA